MRQPLQKATVWAFSALFGCISLFGTGWHHFVGHAYHGGSCQVAHQAHGDRGTCHHHGLSDASHKARASHKTDSGHHDGWTLAVDHDCPLCKFFAQAQWVAGELPAELTYPAGQRARPAAPTFTLDAVGLYRSRAPPIGLLFS